MTKSYTLIDQANCRKDFEDLQFLIGAYPIAIVNAIMIFINLYFLINILTKKDLFTILKLSYDSEYLHSFIEFHKKDILLRFPDYKHENEGDHLSFFVLRNMIPAGVIIASLHNGEAEILLDYVIPGYRDFGVGKFIFKNKAGYFLESGIQCFTYKPNGSKHIRYLKKMGFTEGDGEYILQLHHDIINDDKV